MFMDVDTSSFGQQLSGPGSCWRDVYPSSTMECNSASCSPNEGDYTYWLTVRVPDGKSTSDFFKDEDISYDLAKRYYISRCAVCVSDFKLMAFHSFKLSLPSAGSIAPLQQAGWKIVREGYSYFMQVGPERGFGNALQSHASCLEYFSPSMIAQTYGMKIRFSTFNFKSMWGMYNIDDIAKVPCDSYQERQSFIQKHITRCYVMKRTAGITYYYSAVEDEGYED